LAVAAQPARAGEVFRWAAEKESIDIKAQIKQGPKMKMKTRVERINPYLDVSDLSASINYYVDVLGFELYVETTELGIVERDGHQIHLSRSEESRDSQQIWIGVEDVEVLYEQYQESGAVIWQEPRNYPWAYQMAVKDLDGNRLIFGSEPKEMEPNQK
jgi:uncharacterized glyoxalase superfamily protein PhnB